VRGTAQVGNQKRQAADGGLLVSVQSRTSSGELSTTAAARTVGAELQGVGITQPGLRTLGRQPLVPGRRGAARPINSRAHSSRKTASTVPGVLSRGSVASHRQGTDKHRGGCIPGPGERAGV